VLTEKAEGWIFLSVKKEANLSAREKVGDGGVRVMILPPS